MSCVTLVASILEINPGLTEFHGAAARVSTQGQGPSVADLLLSGASLAAITELARDHDYEQDEQDSGLRGWHLWEDKVLREVTTSAGKGVHEIDQRKRLRV